ncbi:MAG: fibronectin type III domain-containing protein, partial [Patescibacteria group bacterium]
MLIGKKQIFTGIIVILGLVIVAVYAPNKAEADINSCSASVIPATVNPNQTAIFQIQITNTDSNNINWIRITRPSSNFTIISNESTGWAASTTEEYAYQSDNVLAPGDTMTVNVEATAAGTTAPSADWIVETTDVPGVNLFACSGNLGTSISGGAGDTTPPNIYNISVSNIRTTSVDVTWSTDEPSTSLVYYGLDEQYGSSTNEDSSLTISHNMTISGLIPNQAYHFQVVSRDGNGNVSLSADNTFLTSAVDPPSPAEIIVNASSTDNGFIKTKVALKAVPTEKTPPVVVISTNLDKPFKQAPLISGEAADNESVAGLQYSTDNGKNWLPVDTDKGLGTNKASFSFKPANLDDGNYTVIVRAIDISSNIGVSAVKTLIIDRLPPQVGGSNISAGPQIFQPNEEGTTYALVGVDQKITFSAVGGATDIAIDAKTLSGKGDGKLFNLTKSIDTGLWSGVISFEDAGEYILTANSVDGAGNKTSKIIATVQALQPAKIMSKNNPLKDASVV